MLGEQVLASGDLRQYDAIMTGTRAFAVREDLKTHNQRLRANLLSLGKQQARFLAPASYFSLRTYWNVYLKLSIIVYTSDRLAVV